MTIIQAIILGIVQGITEFLPISSSGHLVIVPYLLGWNIPKAQAFPFDVLVQISTLIAVIFYFWKDLIEIAQSMYKGIKSKKPFESIPARTGWLAILATIPAGLVGLALKDEIEKAFSNPTIAAGLLIITAAMLFISEKLGKKSRDISELNWIDAILMGVAQALAVFPGISRSGSTISGGLGRNLDRKTAGQFAFLMAIPIMSAAGLLSIIDLVKIPNLTNFLPVMAAGFITSGVVGFFSIKWLLTYIKNHDLTPFAYYCLVIGLGTLALSFFNPTSSPATANNLEKQTFQITYQSPASWMLADMNACIETISSSNVLLSQSESGQLPENSDLHISYGELAPSPAHIYQIGSDALLLAANHQNPMNSLAQEDLVSIFSGEITSYDALSISCKNCEILENTENNFQTWVYPEESNLSEKLAATYGFTIHSPFSLIAPTTVILKQALNTDINSIGFLPEHLIDHDLKIIVINGLPENPSEIPILASSATEIDDSLKNWIACLQHSVR